MKLKGGNCRVYNGDLYVKFLNSYVLPDASIICGKITMERIRHFNVATNPEIVFEVLSPKSTQKYDKDGKLKGYQGVPSLKDYVTISQDKVEITHHYKDVNGEWQNRDYQDGAINLSIGCSLSLEEIYDEIDFSDDDKPTLKLVT